MEDIIRYSTRILDYQARFKALCLDDGVIFRFSVKSPKIRKVLTFDEVSEVIFDKDRLFYEPKGEKKYEVYRKLVREVVIDLEKEVKGLLKYKDKICRNQFDEEVKEKINRIFSDLAFILKIDEAYLESLNSKEDKLLRVILKKKLRSLTR